MTIACGMKFKDGIMLFADTEYSGYDMKTSGTKLFPAEFCWGKAIFSFSGPEAIGKSAISKCIRALRKTEYVDNDGAADVVEQVVSEEYAARVLSAQQNQNDFSVLFASYHHEQKACDLFASYQTAITRFLTHRCIGVGASLGHYLIDRNYSTSLDLDSATILAVRTLTHIKRYVPGCGGRTEVTVLRNDGSVTPIHSTYLAEFMEEEITLFDAHSSMLFTATMRLDIEDRLFEDMLDLTVKGAREIRQRVKFHQSSIKTINRQLAEDYRARQEGIVEDNQE